MLDHIFLRFDAEIASSGGALKIETIAGVYLAAANIAHTPVRNHVEVLCRLALKFVDVISQVAADFHLEADSLKLKVGINSGPLIGGVIGRLLPRYRCGWACFAFWPPQLQRLLILAISSGVINGLSQGSARRFMTDASFSLCLFPPFPLPSPHMQDIWRHGTMRFLFTFLHMCAVCVVACTFPPVFPMVCRTHGAQ